MIAVCQEKGLVPFLDMAYQGFGKGLDEDAWSIRRFAESGMNFLVSTSYSKSFNLYGERIGALTVVTPNATEAQVVMTQLKAVIRANYSNPPAHGARIVSHVLSDAKNYAHWEQELAGMRDRIRTMRAALAEEMARIGAKRDFSFVTRQAGMFSFTGLTPNRLTALRPNSASTPYVTTASVSAGSTRRTSPTLQRPLPRSFKTRARFNRQSRLRAVLFMQFYCVTQ